MRRFLPPSVVGAVVLATLVVTATGAQAAPGPVTVRVEGSTATLLPPTLVATTNGAYTPVGKTAACPGTSAAAALDLATLAGGTSGWAGTFNAGFGDYFVTAIAGEVHPTGAADGSYWSFWSDNAPAQTGICGQQLSAGDQILFFPDCFGACPAGFVSPNVLTMTAPPAVVQKGSVATVTVTSYANADGKPSAAVGATVSGGGVSATTGAAGTASLTFATTGTFTLRATAANSVRSEPHTVCVHDGNDGNCGTTAPPGTTPTPPPATTPAATPPPCVHRGDDGLCGTADRTPPTGHLAVAENTRFAHGHGPRTIAGHVDPDPSGLRDVRLRLTRVVSHGRCEAFAATRRRWVSAHCGIAYAPFFSIGRGGTFSYLMPARLARGRYTVDVAATDGAGNRDAPAPGRNRIVFRVE